MLLILDRQISQLLYSKNDRVEQLSAPPGDVNSMRSPRRGIESRQRSPPGFGPVVRFLMEARLPAGKRLRSRNPNGRHCTPSWPFCEEGNREIESGSRRELAGYRICQRVPVRSLSL